MHNLDDILALFLQMFINLHIPSSFEKSWHKDGQEKRFWEWLCQWKATAINLPWWTRHHAWQNKIIYFYKIKLKATLISAFMTSFTLKGKFKAYLFINFSKIDNSLNIMFLKLTTFMANFLTWLIFYFTKCFMITCDFINKRKTVRINRVQIMY